MSIGAANQREKKNILTDHTLLSQSLSQLELTEGKEEIKEKLTALAAKQKRLLACLTRQKEITSKLMEINTQSTLLSPPPPLPPPSKKLRVAKTCGVLDQPLLMLPSAVGPVPVSISQPRSSSHTMYKTLPTHHIPNTDPHSQSTSVQDNNTNKSSQLSASAAAGRKVRSQLIQREPDQSLQRDRPLPNQSLDQPRLNQSLQRDLPHPDQSLQRDRSHPDLSQPVPLDVLIKHKFLQPEKNCISCNLLVHIDSL